MARDSQHTFIHLHKSHHADLLEDFARLRMEHEEILVATQHLPTNPEDEDDVVPNEHAAFGIQRATQRQVEPAWRDLGLDRIASGPPPANGAKAGGGSIGLAGRISGIRNMR